MAETHGKYYIAPNSEIRVLKRIPLDDTYEHTIAWGDDTGARTRQANYFKSKTKYVFSKQSYTRVRRGWIRVGRPDAVMPSGNLEAKRFLCADDFYDCNYIMFQNTSFGDKWFYAFITGVDYINDNTTEISYEIDVMQTWLRGVYNDYDPEPCYVERMHVADDSMYINTVPEELNLGNEYVVKYTSFCNLSDTCIVVLAGGIYHETDISFMDEWVWPDGKVYNNVYGNLQMEAFRTNERGIAACNKYINKYIADGKENDILAIYMVPVDFIKTPNNSTKPLRVETGINAPKQGNALGTIGKPYVPKNNKLYTYPYSRLRVTNQAGQEREYKWELFDNDRLRGSFELIGKVAWVPAAMIAPYGYKGFSYSKQQANNIHAYEPLIDFGNSLTIEDFPICAWIGDSFRAWWAQNANSVGAGILSGIATLAFAGATIATGGAAGAIAGVSSSILAGGTALGGLNSLMKTFASITGAKHMADETHGDIKSGNMGAATQNIGFAFYTESYRAEILKLCDDFFTKFGYAIKDVRKPGWMNRERWTYVKTVGFNMTGSFNQEDMRKICTIYDNGITFWKNPNDIGNYEFSNKPII